MRPSLFNHRGLCPAPGPSAIEQGEASSGLSSQGQLQTASWVLRRSGPAPPLPRLPAGRSLCQPRAHTHPRRHARTHSISLSPWRTPARGAHTRHTHAGGWRRPRKEGTDWPWTHRRPRLREEAREPEAAAEVGGRGKKAKGHREDPKKRPSRVGESHWLPQGWDSSNPRAREGPLDWSRRTRRHHLPSCTCAGALLGTPLRS
jgi:hypothetical protein